MEALQSILTNRQHFFQVLGVIFAVIVILKILKEFVNQLRLYVFPRIRAQQNLTTTYGKWAVITGGTDGIGRGIAIELAKRGMDICVISNFENDIVSVIKKRYQVQCKWIYVDFSSADVYSKLEEELSKLDDIGILVNNVGMVQSKLEAVFNQNETFFQKIMNVNVTSTIMMTHIVLKTMIKKDKGLIVNMGSITSILPMAYGTLYSSSKSFIETYSICLASELNETNVQVKCLQPWFVRTQLIKNMSEKVNSWLASSLIGWTFPDPESFAASSVATFGISTPLLYNGYWSHSLVQFLIPHSLVGKKFIADVFKWFAMKIDVE